MDDYAEAVAHSSLGRKTADEHVALVRSSVSHLENLISGAKSRYAAGHTLHTMTGASQLHLLAASNTSTTTTSSSTSSSTMVSSTTSRVSLLQNPGRWVDLETSFVEAMLEKEEAEKNLSMSVPSTKNKKGSKRKELQRKQQQAKKGGKKNGQNGNGDGVGDAVPVVVHSIPPSFAPIPCKPIFYDIALNYLDADVADILDEKCGVKKKKATRSAVSSSAASGTGETEEASTGLVGAATSILGWFSGK